MVVDILAGSGTTAAVAHKMRRRWLTVERNTQTVLDSTLPRMLKVRLGLLVLGYQPLSHATRELAYLDVELSAAMVSLIDG